MIGKSSDSGFVQVLDGITIKTLVHGSRTLMTEFHLSAGSVLPEHSHPFEQTGCLVRGSITLYIAGKPYAMSPGDSWCIPPDVPHRADISEDSVAMEIFSPPREDYMKYLYEKDIVRND